MTDDTDNSQAEAPAIDPRTPKSGFAQMGFTLGGEPIEAGQPLTLPTNQFNDLAGVGLVGETPPPAAAAPEGEAADAATPPAPETPPAPAPARRQRESRTSR